MNPFVTFWRRLRSLAQRREVTQEIDAELGFHLEQRTIENVEAGMSPEDAAREARKRFGNLHSVREECRDARGAGFGDAFLQDVRFGLRMLRKNPGFTSVAVLTLALGIGANTAVFSVINGVLLRPLPYHDPERLVAVCQSNLKRGFSQITVTPAKLREWQEQNSVFEELGGQIYASLTLTGAGQPVHLHAQYTTPNYFSIFGVPPLLGRTFIVDDKPPAGHRVAVLSHGLWQRSFGGDRGVIGTTITLSGLNFTVVGVMPEEFKIYRPPNIFGLPTGDVQPQLWIPHPGSMSEQTNHFFLVFGRLKQGVSPAQAQAEITAITQRAAADNPVQQDWGACVQPLAEEIVGNVRPALRLLLGAVAFVLLIACANVANLALARAATRDREFAIRFALGAGRLRIVRQLLVESTLLAVLGGGLGVLLADWGFAGLMALQPGNLPRLDEVRLDGSVLAFSVVVSLLTGFLSGLAPALHASKPDLNAALKECSRGASEGSSRRRARGVLVMAEVALAMVLLAGAGLMLNSFVRLTGIDPGFRPGHLTIFDASPAGRVYDEDAKRLQLVKLIRERVAAHPGVKAAATVYGLPFGTMLNALVAGSIEGRPAKDNTSSAWRVVSANYFETMGAGLVAGRGFSEKTDTSNSPTVLIINEAFQRKYFAAGGAVGKRINLFTLNTNWGEIIGIVRDVKITGLDAPAVPEAYQVDAQSAPWLFSLVVKSALPRRQVEDIVRTQAAAVDPTLPLYNIRTMDQAVSASVASRRFTMVLIGLFAALALVLTAVGVHGVVAYSVSQRTREIGIRMALGATRTAVIGMVLRQGMGVAVAGIGIGLMGSFVLGRLIASQLFGISASDPLTLGAVAMLLLLVTLTACYLPARRATMVDPMAALRYE